MFDPHTLLQLVAAFDQPVELLHVAGLVEVEASADGNAIDADWDQGPAAEIWSTTLEQEEDA